jgi:uncharacterized phage protein (TIGR01671 family)
MRDYLFRGKRKDGVWVYGDLEHNGDLDVRIQGYVVIPETVGQFTGLTDKKGVKIFDNDIAKDNKDFIGYVYRSDLDLTYFIKWEHTRELLAWERNEKKITTDLEVIGNIHDNPELLEQK